MDVIDPILDKKLQSLLDKEQAGDDCDAYESYRLLKQWVKHSDPIVAWPIESRLERMREHVMNVVHESDSPDKIF